MPVLKPLDTGFRKLVPSPARSRADVGFWMLDVGAEPPTSKIQHPTSYLKPTSNILHLDTQGRHLAASRQLEIEDHLGNEDGCKHIREQADHQGDGESAHRAGAEHEQESAGDNRGDVRIDDRPPGFAETSVHS